MDVALRSVFVEEPAAFRIDAAHQGDALPHGADPRRPLAADPRRGRRLRNELAARRRAAHCHSRRRSSRDGGSAVGFGRGFARIAGGLVLAYFQPATLSQALRSVAWVFSHCVTDAVSASGILSTRSEEHTSELQS